METETVTPPAAGNLSVLVGNGLSIAFNADLNLAAITTEVIKRIGSDSDAGTEITRVMRRISGRLAQNSTGDVDFEVLVGAFGAQSETLEHLGALAGMVAPNDKALATAIGVTRAFARRVRDTGISHVLEVIFERSHARADLADSLNEFVRSVTQSFPGEVMIGNLNYDTLLLSGLMDVCDLGTFADMGHGYKQVKVTTDDGGSRLLPALRETADFPTGRRIKLLQLHGSLSFWKNPAGVHTKLTTDFLKAHGFWKKIRDESTELRPVVILANQQDKIGLVQEYPFSLAYEAFRTSISCSNSWLVVGYSFRDECVNEVLRGEFESREKKPEVLVVTHGEFPTRETIELALGWSRASEGRSTSWLSIERSGADGMPESAKWKTFCCGRSGAGIPSPAGR